MTNFIFRLGPLMWWAIPIGVVWDMMVKGKGR